MSINFDINDLISNLITLEKDGGQFYRALAEKTDKIDCKLLFKMLAEEEEKHQAIYEGLLKENQQIVSIDKEYGEYLELIIKSHFNLDSDKVDACHNLNEALELAISLEKESLVFLAEFSKLVGTKDEATISMMRAEERKHLKLLLEMKAQQA